MNKAIFTDKRGIRFIRLIANTEVEVEIIKILVASRVRWVEVDIHNGGEELPKGYIDLVDETQDDTILERLEK